MSNISIAITPAPKRGKDSNGQLVIGLNRLNGLRATATETIDTDRIRVAVFALKLGALLNSAGQKSVYIISLVDYFEYNITARQNLNLSTKSYGLWLNSATNELKARLVEMSLVRQNTVLAFTP